MRVLVVDDERLARLELRRLLAVHPGVDVVGEAGSIAGALAQVAALKPDLALVNVQLPDGSGYDLFDAFDALDASDDAPELLFTTGHGPRLPEALLKPIDPERLAAAVQRVAVRLGMGPGRQQRKLFIRDGERCWLLRLDDVRLFEAEGSGTRAYLPGAAPLIARSLREIEVKLDPQRFLRASQRHIVNLADVRRISQSSDGGLQLDVAGMPVALLERAAHHAD
ncbi:LytTR family DNA-binding domain-containing protein [Massilia sp. SR12]